MRSNVVLRNLPPGPTVTFVPGICPPQLSFAVIPSWNPVPKIWGLTIPEFPPAVGVIAVIDNVWLVPSGNFVTKASPVPFLDG